jgi:hypothetical protein
MWKLKSTVINLDLQQKANIWQTRKNLHHDTALLNDQPAVYWIAWVRGWKIRLHKQAYLMGVSAVEPTHMFSGSVDSMFRAAQC